MNNPLCRPVTIASGLLGTWGVIVSQPLLADQLIYDDLIVIGSQCIGSDCNNGESFGFDTLRLKENNLRIKFEDTSSTASFPGNDWTLGANDSTNGGDNKFYIYDVDADSTIFTLEAGAPTNSLYVDDSGYVGLGTNTPTMELQMQSSDTPTIRLDQDTSYGYSEQSWDVGANEINFFIRDTTNVTVPLRIKPAAPSNSLYIDASGNLLLGTSNNSSDNQIQVSNGAYLSKGGVWMQPNDATLVENQAVMDSEDAMAAFTELEPVTYSYTDEADVYYAGFSEASITSAFEQFSDGSSDGGTVYAGLTNSNKTGLAMSDMVAILTSVVQQQQATITALEARIEALETP